MLLKAAKLLVTFMQVMPSFCTQLHAYIIINIIKKTCLEITSENTLVT